MSSRDSRKNPSSAGGGGTAERRDRLAAELRANLKKRKKRGRAPGSQPAEDGGAAATDMDTDTEKPE